MTLPIKFANYAFSTLAVGCDSAATSLSVPAGHGARFPALAAGEYFYATLENAALNREIVKVTARVDDTLTVLRAQDNTTARAWNAGDSLSLRVNAAAFADISKAANHEYTPAGTGAVATTVQSKLRETVSVKDFGAVGDGVTDDTAAIQFALSSTATEIIFPPGNYRVVDALLDGSPVLTSAVANRKLHGPGIITATSQVKKLLLVTGDHSTVSLNIDGNLQIGYAVVIQAENPVVTGCSISNLDGKTNYGGVAINLDLDDLDTAALVSNNTIRNLQGAGEGVGGNGVGMQRAITINSNQNCTKRILVTGNHVSQVEGEEGDAIVVISSNGAGTYYNMPVVIQGNTIDLWTRRAVKVQAHGVTICGNTFRNDRAVNPGNLQRAVDIVQGGAAVIDGNRFSACKYQTQIGANYSAPEAANNFAVTNNVIEGIGTETTSSIIGMNTFGSGVVVAANTILCPAFANTAIAVTNCTEAVVAANTIVSNNLTWYSFTGSTNVRMFSNVLGNSLKAPYDAVYDLANDEFAFDVSNGRSITLRQSDTVLSDGEVVAKIKCRQNDASAPEAIHASIGFVAEGSSGSLGVGIFTGGVGAADTEKVRVSSAGVLRPTGDNTQTLGAAANRWSVVYAGTGTINTSDEREKQDVSALDAAERRVAVSLKGLIRKFRYRDAVAQKGDAARIHVGVLAQDVIAAFEAEGLDPFVYAIVCYDEWNETPETRDEKGGIVQQYRAAGNRYGVRYEELLAFIIAAI